MSSRRDLITTLYIEKADELHRAVGRAIDGPEARVEDACSHAWHQLLRHSEVEISDRGFSWLYVVAVREGYRLSDRDRREVAAGAPSDLPVQSLPSRGDRFGVHRARVELVLALPARKRELVLLHAAGFTYPEIARLTGNSLRTVERQLLRGKRALRQADRLISSEAVQ